MNAILGITPEIIIESCIISIVVSSLLFIFIVIMWQQNKAIITNKKKGYLINTMIVLIGIMAIASIVIIITAIENPSLNNQELYNEFIEQTNRKLSNFK